MNGFEVRFEYDNAKLQPSNISTNELVTDVSNVNDYFKFESEFAGTSERPILMMDTDINEPGKANNVIIATMELYPPLSTLPTSEHIIVKNGNKTISTGEKVKFGEMSFQMLNNDDPFDITGFKIKKNENYSPTTGAKINLDAVHCFNYVNYTDQQKDGIFRFTDETASKNADLENIVVSSGEVNTEEPDKSTYKEYNLEPKFNIGTKKYEVTLLEYIDTINITATAPEDSKSTMKIKVPKHDADGNLLYDSDGTEITYEEKDMTDSVPFGVTLNKLGDPDTKVTISITAEDGVTKNEYEIIIKRPYGIITGSVYTAPTDSKGIFKANIRVYKTSEVEDLIDKSQIVEGRPDDVHEKLLTLKSQDFKTNDDGTYEIYVIPGTYDIVIDKPGYLDHIYESRTVVENQTTELGYKEILAGDTNKDGTVEITDLTTVLNAYGMSSTDTDYSESTNFNDDDYVEITDLTALLGNYLEARQIK